MPAAKSKELSSFTGTYTYSHRLSSDLHMPAVAHVPTLPAPIHARYKWVKGNKGVTGGDIGRAGGLGREVGTGFLVELCCALCPRLSPFFP